MSSGELAAIDPDRISTTVASRYLFLPLLFCLCAILIASYHSYSHGSAARYPSPHFARSSARAPRRGSSFGELINEVVYANMLSSQHEYHERLRRHCHCSCGRTIAPTVWSRVEPCCTDCEPNPKLERCRLHLRKVCAPPPLAFHSLGLREGLQRGGRTALRADDVGARHASQTVRAKIRALLCMKTYTCDHASSVIMLHTNQWIEATDPKHRCALRLPARVGELKLYWDANWRLSNGADDALGTAGTLCTTSLRGCRAPRTARSSSGWTTGTGCGWTWRCCRVRNWRVVPSSTVGS